MLFPAVSFDELLSLALERRVKDLSLSESYSKGKTNCLLAPKLIGLTWQAPKN